MNGAPLRNAVMAHFFRVPAYLRALSISQGRASLRSIPERSICILNLERERASCFQRGAPSLEPHNAIKRAPIDTLDTRPALGGALFLGSPETKRFRNTSPDARNALD